MSRTIAFDTIGSGETQSALVQFWATIALSSLSESLTAKPVPKKAMIFFFNNKNPFLHVNFVHSLFGAQIG